MCVYVRVCVCVCVYIEHFQTAEGSVPLGAHRWFLCCVGTVIRGTVYLPAVALARRPSIVAVIRCSVDRDLKLISRAIATMPFPVTAASTLGLSSQTSLRLRRSMEQEITLLSTIKQTSPFVIQRCHPGSIGK